MYRVRCKKNPKLPGAAKKKAIRILPRKGEKISNAHFCVSSLQLNIAFCRRSRVTTRVFLHSTFPCEPYFLMLTQECILDPTKNACFSRTQHVALNLCHLDCAIRKKQHWAMCVAPHMTIAYSGTIHPKNPADYLHKCTTYVPCSTHYRCLPVSSEPQIPSGFATDIHFRRL